MIIPKALTRAEFGEVTELVLMTAMGGNRTLRDACLAHPMAIRWALFVGTGWLLLLSAGCSREPKVPDVNVEDAVAPDACDIMRLSPDKLPRSIAEAERGSVEAQERLWDHYSCVDKAKAAYWQDRLIEQNDWQAMAVRADTLFSEASDKADNDRRKLGMLLAAQDLEARARKARGNGVDTVLVNGKDVRVPFSSEPTEFTKRLESEVARLQKR